MIELEHTVTIQRPVDEVFQYVSNVENLPEWAEVARSARKTTPDGVTVGAKAQVEIELHGRHALATYRVTKYERDRLFAFDTTDAPFNLENVYYFEPENGGTRLRITSNGSARGFSRFIEGFVARMLDRQFVSDHDRLKRILEARASA